MDKEPNAPRRTELIHEVIRYNPPWGRKDRTEIWWVLQPLLVRIGAELGQRAREDVVCATGREHHGEDENRPQYALVHVVVRLVEERGRYELHRADGKAA